MNIAIQFFDQLALFWESKKANRFFSLALIVIFVFFLGIAVINYTIGYYFFPYQEHIGFYSCINMSFSFLLLLEMISLVFVIPQSIANSIGKQFEILCLILLRSAFKEFSKIDLIHQLDFSNDAVLKMIADGVSALLLFLCLAFYYKIQKHRPISVLAEDTQKFIVIKKLIALSVLFILAAATGIVTIQSIQSGELKYSFNNFYVVLILADLFFMLIAFRYVIHFPDVFRYSAFVLITIFIRLSLTAPVYWNGVLAIFTCLYAIGVVSFHNFFVGGRIKSLQEKK